MTPDPFEEYDRLVNADHEPEEAPQRYLVPHAGQTQPRAMYAFLAAQGVLEDAAAGLGVYMTKIADQLAIWFPYTDATERVRARRYRLNGAPAIEEEDGSSPALFNLASVSQGDPSAPCIITSDELAVGQWISAGFTAAICPLPGKIGASIAEGQEALAKRNKIYLDFEDARVREELARRLGRHRCWSVTRTTRTIPTRDDLILAVDQAEPWPMEGTQIVRPGLLRAWRDAPPPPTLSTGTAATDAVLKIPGEGRLIVITGIPNHGKSTFLSHLSVHLMRAEARRFLVFSPENQPWEAFAARVAETLIGKPMRARRNGKLPRMTDEELDHAERWLRRRMIMLVKDAEDSPPTVDWLLERAAQEAVRFGITDFIIDPWNEVEHQRGNMSEVEYLGRSLQRLRAFGLRHGINVWIVAHPTKLAPVKPGQAILPPSLYDIAGGAMWANKSDIGIVVHTDDDDTTRIIIRKLRFAERWGVRGGSARLKLIAETGQYQSADS